MWKPIAAALMCLGFIMLGVAAFGGQEVDDTDLIVIEGKPEGVAVPAAPVDGVVKPEEQPRERIVEVEVGKGLRRFEIREDRDDVTASDDGKTAQKYKAQVLRHLRAATPANAAGPIVDPATREALDKFIAGLKEEAQRLDAEGKKDESARKWHSIKALDQLLKPGTVWAVTTERAPHSNRTLRGEESTRTGQEMKKLDARLAELREQAAKNQDGEAHARLQQQIAELHRQLAERQRQLTGAADPFAHIWNMWPDVPEAAALSQKANALGRAAAQLQKAGLEDQSRELRKQAEWLEAEAEKMRAQARSTQGRAGDAVGGPTMDLQHSIHELKEQIQQLRKEIGELRELVQQTRK